MCVCIQWFDCLLFSTFTNETHVSSPVTRMMWPRNSLPFCGTALKSQGRSHSLHSVYTHDHFQNPSCQVKCILSPSFTWHCEYKEITSLLDLWRAITSTGIFPNISEIKRTMTALCKDLLVMDCTALHFYLVPSADIIFYLTCYLLLHPWTHGESLFHNNNIILSPIQTVPWAINK
jgi:hypothetical protein